ncbi:hypothetical protein DAQ11_23665 [Salmonella enterica subsp. enterica serovar Enteritidis]|nr:hypothetical protein [Salmonella enterica subsp. enterica serovar Enteritidis]EBZ8819649.1 hypothetical protein [Salmonella enterica subsp. enterica serovar Stanley]ECA6566297.1 hypothetical protein [Salmonella enterica subsp. enterica serovar Agona]MEP52630.1 hypothetical protein [Salmonella enterica]
MFEFETNAGELASCDRRYFSSKCFSVYSMVFIRSSAALFVPRFAAVRLSPSCGAVRLKGLKRPLGGLD